MRRRVRATNRGNEVVFRRFSVGARNSRLGLRGSRGPLGGSRCPLPRYLFNVLVTWFLMGLWHGAAWHYVAWGLYHGALVAGHRFWRKRRPEGAPSGAWTVPATYLAMNAGWLLFRAPDLGAVANYFSGAARAASVPDGAAAAIMLLIFLIYSIPLLLALLWERRPAAFSGIDAGAVRIVYSAACLLCLLVFGGISNEFIYFQF